MYVGGLGINYKSQVVLFEQTSGDDEYSPTQLTVVPSKTKTKQKNEIRLTLGRLGHLAQLSKEDQAIYIFGGQQERIGNAG